MLVNKALNQLTSFKFEYVEELCYMIRNEKCSYVFIQRLFRVEGEGIVNIPFTSVSKETLNNLLEQFNAPETNNEIIGETKL